MKADLYAQSGEKKGEVTLIKEIFEVPFNKDLVHQALVYQLANARIAIAHTKTRKDVRGGGVVFGPNKDRNFSKKMPKKMRRKALFCALSEKAKEGMVMALEKYEGETKTKPLVELLKKLPIKRDVLIVVPGRDETIERSSKNIENAKTIHVNYLNIKDLQKFDNVLFTKEALEKLEDVFLTETKLAKADNE